MMHCEVVHISGSTRKTGGHLTSHGYNRETARAQSEIVETPHGHRTGSLRFQLNLHEDPTISLRSPYGSDSEHRRKLEQEIVRCLYEL